MRFYPGFLAPLVPAGIICFAVYGAWRFRRERSTWLGLALLVLPLAWAVFLLRAAARVDPLVLEADPSRLRAIVLTADAAPPIRIVAPEALSAITRALREGAPETPSHATIYRRVELAFEYPETVATSTAEVTNQGTFVTVYAGGWVVYVERADGLAAVLARYGTHN